MLKQALILIAYLLLIICNSAAIFAQTNSPQSINCSGTSMNFENTYINFTVGDLVVLNHSDNQGNSLGSGFTTCATITTLAIAEISSPSLNVKLYPNPTTGMLNISIEDNSMKYLLISITDIQGKEIYKGKYAGIPNTISLNLTECPPGIYLVSMHNQDNGFFNSYKITIK